MLDGDTDDDMLLKKIETARPLSRAILLEREVASQAQEVPRGTGVRTLSGVFFGGEEGGTWLIAVFS